jgi:hypothetical protein
MKTTIAIPLAQCYVLHASLSDVPATGQRHLLLQTQYLAAKHPHERRTLLSLCLTPHDQHQLADLLQTGIQEHQP